MTAADMHETLPPVLYDDESLLVFDKPSGLLVAPVRDYPDLVNLVDQVQARYGANCMNVHRLDRDTSGVLIFGKSPAACRGMQYVLENRQVEKLYVALTRGSPAADSGTIDGPLAPDPQRTGRMMVDATGKPSVTHYEVIARWPDSALLHVRPQTGRTHQIRVHLTHIGCPIMGDTFYGSESLPPLAATTPNAGRLALHAQRMSFAHPISGLPVTVVAPLPTGLQQTIDILASSQRQQIDYC